MPHKHGISHALAMFVCTIIAPLLAHCLKHYLPIVHEILTGIAEFLKDALNLYYPVEDITPLLLATLLAFIWGIGFYYINKE